MHVEEVLMAGAIHSQCPLFTYITPFNVNVPCYVRGRGCMGMYLNGLGFSERAGKKEMHILMAS